MDDIDQLIHIARRLPLTSGLRSLAPGNPWPWPTWVRLADYPAADLIAELSRRGYKVEEKEPPNVLSEAT